MIMLDEILKNNPDKIYMVLDGLNEAIVGYDNTCTSRLIYSFELILDCLQKDSEMDRDEAEEFFWFNIESLYLMNNGPDFIYPQHFDSVDECFDEE